MNRNGPFPDANEFPYPRLCIPVFRGGSSYPRYCPPTLEYEIYEKRRCDVYAGDTLVKSYLYWEKIA